MTGPSQLHRPTTLSFADHPEAEPVWGSVARHGAVASRHDVHLELELGVVLDGRMQRWWGGHSAELGPGMVWLCSAWEPHGYAVGAAGCRVLVLLVRPQLLAGLVLPEVEGLDWLACFREPPPSRPQLAPAERAEAQAIGERLANLPPCAAREHRLRFRLATIELLGLLLLRGWRPSQPAVRGAPVAGDQEVVTQAMGWLIERHGALPLGEAAARCRLGRNAFARRFERVVGVSFTACAADLRLRGAANDLAGGDAPIKAIARTWGFTDASHLGRVFVRRYGCTPAAYRAQP